MKITKLYTLSQFIDLIEYLQIDNIEWYMSIKKYNDFLKQPLKKEMFVNDIKKPPSLIMYNIQRMECTSDEMRYCREYLDAEKKILFTEGKYINLQPSTRGNFYDIKGITVMIDSNTCQNIPIQMSLFDLAEKTKGDLELINTDI